MLGDTGAMEDGKEDKGEAMSVHYLNSEKVTGFLDSGLAERRNAITSLPGYG